MPQWLLSTSMLSVSADFFSTQPCQAQTPSVRLNMAVVGTGASAYRFVPEIAPKVAHLTVFQRRPNWCTPLHNRPISRAEVILNARVVGGIHMVDHGEADDKIIAVLQNDTVWGKARDVSDIPEIAIERLRHYFATYKLVPGKESEVSVDNIYDCKHARLVVQAAHEDYDEMYGH